MSHFLFVLYGSILTGTLLVAFPADAASVSIDPPACASSTKCDHDPGNLEAFVRSFYQWYTGRPDDAPTDWNAEPNRSIFRTNLTPEFRSRFQKIVDDTDSDPLTGAQDFPRSWSSHVDVKLVKLVKNKAILHVNMGIAPDSPDSLLVELIPSKGIWRINDVHPKSPDEHQGR